MCDWRQVQDLRCAEITNKTKEGVGTGIHSESLLELNMYLYIMNFTLCHQ